MRCAQPCPHTALCGTWDGGHGDKCIFNWLCSFSHFAMGALSLRGGPCVPCPTLPYPGAEMGSSDGTNFGPHIALQQLAPQLGQEKESRGMETLETNLLETNPAQPRDLNVAPTGLGAEGTGQQQPEPGGQPGQQCGAEGRCGAERRRGAGSDPSQPGSSSSPHAQDGGSAALLGAQGSRCGHLGIAPLPATSRGCALELPGRAACCFAPAAGALPSRYPARMLISDGGTLFVLSKAGQVV